MKPTLEMEKPQQPAMVIVQQPEQMDMVKKSHTKRWVIGAVVGLVAVGVIAAIVLVSVHVAVKLTRDNYKEAMVTFNNVQGNKKVEEKITVTDTEEDIEVPNKFRVIYDYQTGLMVMQFTNTNDETDGICYMSRFNTSAGDDIVKVKEEMKSDVMERNVSSETTEQSYESVGEQVDRDLMSPRAREMCEGHPVYWARENAETGDAAGREKRATCFYKYYLFCRFGRCWILRIRYCYS